MAIKRKASSAAANTAKRHGGSSWDSCEKANALKQCSVVGTAVRGAKDYPESVRKMVSLTVHECLGVPKEDRHPYQQQNIGMVGEVLASVESGIKTRVRAAEGKLAEATTEEDSRNRAYGDAASALAAKSEAAESARVALSESVAATKAAKGSLADAESEQKDGDAQCASMAEKKARLEAALNVAFVPLEDGALEGVAAKPKIAMVAKAAQECKFDPSLIASVAPTLATAPADRGTFDALVCRQLKGELRSHITAAEDTLATREAAKAALAKTVEIAKAGFEQAQEHEVACRAAVDHSKHEAEGAKASAKETAQSVSKFGAEMKQVEKDLASANADLAALTEGALAAYQEMSEYTKLSDYTAVLPPAAEVEPTPAGEAPAATQ